mmetsp:Transcript_99664/g.279113  ORF Transcript_99664/g.279113 Transcript_99664/m.279113 type:complete len:130 (-) Transcript_99664:148-537(-)
MGAACCSGSEPNGSQSEQKDPTKVDPVQQEVVLPSLSPKVDAGKPNEWNITLVKAEGVKLGIDVDLNDNTVLVVEAIHDGLVSNWNKAHPDREVKSGDKVVSVNGTKGNAASMVDVIKTEATLEMVVQR